MQVHLTFIVWFRFCKVDCMTFLKYTCWHRCFITILFLMAACGARKGPKETSFPKQNSPATKQFKSAATGTQNTVRPDRLDIEAHVYDPGRLKVLAASKVVTGVITERNADPDGDEHMLLKPDADADVWLPKKNYKKKKGCLVVEVVCANKITRKRARGACDGYTNNVLLPAVGEHVRVTGAYVLDSHNGWAEIHPASLIEKIN